MYHGKEREGVRQAMQRWRKKVLEAKKEGLIDVVRKCHHLCRALWFPETFRRVPSLRVQYCILRLVIAYEP